MIQAQSDGKKYLCDRKSLCQGTVTGGTTDDMAAESQKATANVVPRTREVWKPGLHTSM